MSRSLVVAPIRRVDPDEKLSRLRARARRAYEIRRLSESWPLLGLALALGMLGVALGVPPWVAGCVSVALGGLCIVSLWRRMVGEGCASGMIGGVAGVVVLGCARAFDIEASFAIRAAAFVVACFVMVLVSASAQQRGQFLHWLYWAAAAVALGLTLVIVFCAL